MGKTVEESERQHPIRDMKSEERRRQESWDEDSRQHIASPNSTTSRSRSDSHQTTTPSPKSASRRSVDAAQSQHPRSDSTQHRISYDAATYGAYSHTDYGTTLSPQMSTLRTSGEVRRLSGNFNAPTEIELEREREQRKSLNGVERVRRRVKGWVRA